MEGKEGYRELTAHRLKRVGECSFLFKVAPKNIFILINTTFFFNNKFIFSSENQVSPS